MELAKLNLTAYIMQEPDQATATLLSSFKKIHKEQ